MGRIRTIKPEFYTHEELAQLEPLTRILFSGLWTMADKEGRLEDKVPVIKGNILPFDDCDVNAMLQDLHDSGFINRYTIGNKKYIERPSWEKHQKVNNREAKSKIPPSASKIEDLKPVQVLLGNDQALLGNCQGKICLEREKEREKEVERENKKDNTKVLSKKENILELDQCSTQYSITDGTTNATLEAKKQAKIKYGEFVQMTNAEHEQLAVQFGTQALQTMIEILDNYKGSRGKRYKSDYRAILSWVVKKYFEERDKPRQFGGNAADKLMRKLEFMRREKNEQGGVYPISSSNLSIIS